MKGGHLQAEKRRQGTRKTATASLGLTEKDKKSTQQTMNTLLKIYKMKQDKQLAMNKAVGLQPKRVFGLRTDVAGNVHFTTGQDVVYPAAGVLVIQDYVTNKQKYLR